MNALEHIKNKLTEGKPLRIVFLNDIGFGAGAGIALKRQVCSFLKYGHHVVLIHGIRHIENDLSDSFEPDLPGNWMGSDDFQDLVKSKSLSEKQKSRKIVEKVAEYEPDLVITGNFHGARMPADILLGLRKKGMVVISYFHDCYWFTGHCAYYGDCSQYLIGCSATCPRPKDYPPLEPHKINQAWRERREVFTGPLAIPCAVNSRWLLNRAQEAFAGKADISLLPLGVDTSIFCPTDKKAARKAMGIPENGRYVLMGSFDITETRKNHHLTLHIIETLRHQGVDVIAFGKGSENLQGVLGQGYVSDTRQMARIFNAADIFLSTSVEEAFGQTLLEAAACRTPIVAIDSGGVSDIARQEQNALLVNESDPAKIYTQLNRLIEDPLLCRRMGAASRIIAEKEFSLDRQYLNWRDYLFSLIRKYQNEK